MPQVATIYGRFMYFGHLIAKHWTRFEKPQCNADITRQQNWMSFSYRTETARSVLYTVCVYNCVCPFAMAMRDNAILERERKREKKVSDKCKYYCCITNISVRFVNINGNEQWNKWKKKLVENSMGMSHLQCVQMAQREKKMQTNQRKPLTLIRAHTYVYKLLFWKKKNKNNKMRKKNIEMLSYKPSDRHTLRITDIVIMFT